MKNYRARTVILSGMLLAGTGAFCRLTAADLADVAGQYRRLPIENGWHEGVIRVTDRGGKQVLQWENKAGKSWNLLPDLKNGLLLTDDTNPYQKTGGRNFRLELRGGKVVGFRFLNDLFAKDGFTVMSQKHGGMTGYISAHVSSPPAEYQYGASFYVSIWPLVDEPIANFQIGLPSTWIIPDNRNFMKPLCPPGTKARDNWPERGPYYRDVFQTIEGGAGYWASTRFPSSTPKYRMNGTPNGYNHEISSPGWGFGRTQPLTDQQLGIAQLSNRLLVPPDGLTFVRGTSGEVLGNAWIVTELVSRKAGPAAPTGSQCWTLFLNASNFKGPVAFWLPETWSRLSRRHSEIAGRGLDARPGLMQSGAMEINTVPCFETRAAGGGRWMRIPALRFPVNRRGETSLMQDVMFYADDALRDTGMLDKRRAWQPSMTARGISLRRPADQLPLAEVDQILQTRVFHRRGSRIFGLQWSPQSRDAEFPQYFQKRGDRWVARKADDVPRDIGLQEQEFRPAVATDTYRSPQTPNWTHPGPATDPTTIALSDGSTVTYAWYRFVEQPAVRALNWKEEERNRVQLAVEEIHRRWGPDGRYIPGPSQGQLATMDAAILVTPPAQFAVGYVPIVIEQSGR